MKYIVQYYNFTAAYYVQPENISNHRCRSRQILGVRKMFAQIYPKTFEGALVSLHARFQHQCL